MDITITPTQLHELIRAVRPFAEKTGWIGSEFAAIYVQVRSGWLTALATDRYVAGMSRVRLRGATVVEFGLSAADWDSLLKMYPKPKRGAVENPLTITVGGAGVEVDQPGASPRIRVEFELAAKGSTKGRDSLRAHLAKYSTTEPTPIPGLAFTPQNLAKFAHLGALEVQFTASDKPVVVRSVNFVGMIQPARGSFEREDWTDILGENAEAAA